MTRVVTSSTRIITLVFDKGGIPPAPNDWPSQHMALHRAKNAYRKRAWISALQQWKPPREPWEKIVYNARFHLYALRDDEGLRASLKWLLDTLKQRQFGFNTDDEGKRTANDESVRRWRSGLCVECGYFVDDHPKYARMGNVTQVIDRKRQFLELAIVRST